MSRCLTLEDYNQIEIGDIIIVEIDSVSKTPYSIRGKEDAVLLAEEPVFAYIPSNEYSMYQNKVTGPQDAPGLIFKAEVIKKFKDQEKYVLALSLRNYRRSLLEDRLEEFKTAGYVPAKVIGFVEYGTILSYNGLLLLMTNSSIVNGNKIIKGPHFLARGDMVEVKFHKIKKRGREIRVTPKVMFPAPAWTKTIDVHKLERDQLVRGVVERITPEYIFVTIGKDKDGQRIQGSFRHPSDPFIDSVLTEGIEVISYVNDVTDNGYVYLSFYNVEDDPIFNARIDYMREVEHHDA